MPTDPRGFTYERVVHMVMSSNPAEHLKPNVVHISRDGERVIERLPNGNLKINGMTVERPMTRAEAGAEIEKRVQEKLAAAKCDYKTALYSVLDESATLKRIYVGLSGDN